MIGVWHYYPPFILEANGKKTCMELVNGGIGAVVKSQVTKVVGIAQVMWTHWAKAMQRLHVTGAEAKGIWPKNAVLPLAWWRAARAKVKTAVLKAKQQQYHGSSKEVTGRVKREEGTAAQEKQVARAKVIREHAGIVVRSVTRLTKGNVVAVARVR